MKSDAHILLAPDSFKGSLRANEVCTHLKKGILDSGYTGQITALPLADGGEGTVEAMVESMNGRYCTATVHDPLMRAIDATYGLINEDQVAIIEMAAASGLELISTKDQNPMITTTYGTGELILDALDKGCRRFIIGIGGSATNDGGAGMLEALGAHFFRQSSSGQHSVKGGGALIHLAGIDIRALDSRLQESHFQIACDVTNPLLGDQGATQVYATQKGAQSAQLSKLEAGLQHWGQLLEKETGRSIIQVAGSGAAGGLGAGFLALPHTELKSGFEIIQEMVCLEHHILQADIVITGEGKVDGQTVFGKVVSGVGRMGQKHRKPVICLAGTIGEGSEQLLDHGVTALFSIVNRPMTLTEAIERTPRLLRESARNLVGLINVGLNSPTLCVEVK